MRKFVQKSEVVWLSITLAVGLLASGLLAIAAGVPAQKIEPNAVYMQPIAGLNPEDLKKFQEGEKIFRTSWLIFPSLKIANWEYMRPPAMFAWGLGPTFIANSCMACHVQAGYGKTIEQAGNTVFQQLLRISLPGEGPHGGPLPHPHYGDQLQVFDNIVADRKQVLQGEANVLVDWLKEPVTLPDGVVVELRKPTIRVEGLAFGALGDGVMTSLRNSRAIFGLGYLEAISEEDILTIAAHQKTQNLNGRPNYVYDDIEGKTVLGRFGWKANQPSVRQQIAAAFHGDMGVTTPIYSKQNCPPVQTDCQRMPPGDKLELRADDFDRISFWVASLDAPASRDQRADQVVRGAQLFEKARCAQCHVPELTTRADVAHPALSKRRVAAYTDLLLHDMGAGLADGRPDFKAGPRDWRTAPLWGIGLSKQVNGSTNLLHDGRARNVLEAIVWHGGEAEPARDLFMGFTESQREDLIAFVNAL